MEMEEFHHADNASPVLELCSVSLCVLKARSLYVSVLARLVCPGQGVDLFNWEILDFGFYEDFKSFSIKMIS